MRIDEIAVGDPIEFTLECVRNRLPDMLRNAGAADLADGITDRMEDIRAGVTEVRELMERARHPNRPSRADI